MSHESAAVSPPLFLNLDREFLTNQSVCDTIMSFDDPLEACRSVISQSYSLWLQFDTRTDDITLIVAYIDTPEGKAPRSASEAELAEYEAALKLGKQMGMGAAEGVSMGLSVVGAGSDVKPVRRGLSAEKKKEMGVVNDAEEEDDHTPWKMEVVKKTKDEIERIKSALKGNFLFQHLPDTQAKQIYDVMKRTEVEAGQVVIKQGDKGDAFFVLDDGEYKVTIESDGQQVEILRYKPNPTGANPCFGELALMYSKPRAATVTALTHGRLWEIDRRSFREILKKSSTKYLMRTLRSVEVRMQMTDLVKLAWLRGPSHTVSPLFCGAGAQVALRAPAAAPLGGAHGGHLSTGRFCHHPGRGRRHFLHRLGGQSTRDQKRFGS